MTSLTSPGNLATIDLKKRTKRRECARDKATTARKRLRMTYYL